MEPDIKKEEHARLKEQKELYEPSSTDIIWKHVIVVIFLMFFSFVGLIRCMLFMNNILTWIWAFCVGVASGLGATVGAHRFYSHRSFKADWKLKLLLITLQTLSGQHCAYMWVKAHRLHHKYSDTNADPHNVRRGFWYSQVGWLVMRKHPLVVEKEKQLDLSDIENDFMVMFQKRWYIPLYIVIVIILPVIVPVLLWNETWFDSLCVAYFLRYTIVLNIVGTVNSVAHTWGIKPYDSKIRPTENPIVAFCSLGEGWHNYHHAFPWDYRSAEWGEHNSLGTKFVDWFARKGWAYDLKTASDAIVKKRILRCGETEYLKNGKFPMEEAEPHPDDITPVAM